MFPSAGSRFKFYLKFLWLCFQLWPFGAQWMWEDHTSQMHCGNFENLTRSHHCAREAACVSWPRYSGEESRIHATGKHHIVYIHIKMRTFALVLIFLKYSCAQRSLTYLNKAANLLKWHKGSPTWFYVFSIIWLFLKSLWTYNQSPCSHLSTEGLSKCVLSRKLSPQHPHQLL